MTTTKRVWKHDEPLFTATEYAALCKVTIRTVRRWIATGHLDVIRIGGVVRIRGLATKPR